MGGAVRLAAAVAAVVLWAAVPAHARVFAGVGEADATWHVGASAGQYASSPSADQELDPSVHAFTKRPSYGVQSRLRVRALVVSDGRSQVALVKNDLYIPQDLLWRRTAQILAARGTGIGEDNLVMAVTHDHSSPYYTSTAWGAWTFQDVFDIRAFDYYATRMADAVQQAAAHLVPVRVGAARTQIALSNRNALGPAVADDGTPAGFPDSYTNRDITLVRFDDVSDPRRPRRLANLVNFSLHGENLNGNDLISADFVGPLQRMLDRETGGLTVFTQNAVGNSENERSSYHSVHDRMEFEHREYGQAELNAALLARAVVRLDRELSAGRGDVPMGAGGPVAMADRWFPGPLTHPTPTVSNCRNDQAFAGDPRVPVVGLPDCESLSDLVGYTPPPVPSQDPGVSIDALKRAGIPLPDSTSFPSYAALEEDTSVHLQAFRIGDILFTVCSCEQWADQARNIVTRTDRVSGNEWMGFDWATYRGLDDTGVECFQTPPYDGSAWSCPHPDTARTTPCFRAGDGTWSCPNPTRECLLKGAAFTNTCRGQPFDARLNGIPDARFARMVAQSRACANGWNSAAWAPYAESEPVDVAQIKGPYTCDDGAASARLGYALTVPISMANDYNGYIATYREYQRGDHYRKALTGWGPHSSDYMATRLVKLGRLLNGGPPLDRTLDGAEDPDADAPLLVAKTAADQVAQEVKAQALGGVGARLVDAYTTLVPDDGGTAGALAQPRDLQRFDATSFTWRGGDNYVDNPIVRVERRGAGGSWAPFADQSGEVVTTLRFPSASELPAYLTGGLEWRWTAWFEAFAGREEVPGSPQATPVGTYRFVVDGVRRRGHRSVPYRLSSEPFRVGAWSGIAVDGVDVRPDRRVAVRVGPSTRVEVRGGKTAAATLGPIDYPDTWTAPGQPRFIRPIRTYMADPAAPADGSRFEWYCLTCSFRPWADTGEASRVIVTFARGDRVVARVRAYRAGDHWLTRRHLHHGETAYVCAGGVRDAFGDLNGAPSVTVGRAAGSLRCPRVSLVGAANDVRVTAGTPLH